MGAKIGCLHAHHDNITYINDALAAPDREFIHFVDPGLMQRITADPGFAQGGGAEKVLEQLNWIAASNVDAILITCTNYIALLDEAQLALQLPIIKIDEPFFAQICSTAAPQTILFSNPATVEGTMKRLYDYAELHGHSLPDIQSYTIANTFELFMQGYKQKYIAELTRAIQQLCQREQSSVAPRELSVAQLSMVEAAQEVERERPQLQIANPLRTLADHLDYVLSV
ncbi:hypothetical protein [Paenibacillus sp. GCM10027626]|uniref:hypothetical protein n=1 Tax=Paenibacillus sp. GCM10027626 TaxID=3273411 RepID=UPI0036281A54